MIEHQPFEDWMLSGEPLGREQALALQEHLDGCSDCRGLAEAWSEIRIRLTEAGMVGPAPGFASRWMNRLRRDERRRHSRQVWTILVLKVTGSFLILASLASYVLGSPAYLAISAVKSGTLLSVWIGAIWRLLATLLRILPEASLSVMAAGTLFGLAAIFASLGLLWASSLYRFALQPISNGGKK